MVGDRYDVVVVGGGPAGSMAARAAATKGARTLLLERDSSIGIPVHCGEGISLKSLERFVEVKESWCAARVKGVMLYSPDGTAVVVDSDQVGVVMERSLFDRWLAESAADAGSDILTRADVDGLLFADGRVTGVAYSRLGCSHQVRAGVVIGADGVESRVGRWAGLRTQLIVRDLESAYQMVLAGVDIDTRYCHFYFGNNIAPGGYIWVFPKGGRLASVGIGICARRGDAGEAYRKLVAFIAKHFSRPAVVGEMAGGVPVGRPLKQPIKDGLILAGDAARHCNPLTGGGITTAMIAGSYAGEVAAQAVARGDTSVKGLRRYLNLIDGEIVRPHKRAYRLAEGVVGLSDEVLNWTAHEVASMPEQQRTLRNIFIKGLSSLPRLMVDIVKEFV